MESGVPDGEFTKTIYTMIREQKYNDVSIFYMLIPLKTQM